jgi:uncharacterized membrane protein YbhN (UPF0104 family)
VGSSKKTGTGGRFVLDVNSALIVLGSALFFVLLFRLDPAEISRQLRLAGWAVAPAFGLFVLNLIASTMAWRETIEPGSHGVRVPFFPLFAAFWTGHSIEGVGIATGGEIAKGSLLAKRVPGEEAVSALVIYGFLNAAVTVISATVGPAVALLVFDLPSDIVGVLFAVSTSLALAMLALRWALHRGMADIAVRIADRFRFARGNDLLRFERRARLVEKRFRQFRVERPLAFRRALAWCSLAKLLQVAEAWLLIYACLPDSNLLWLLVVALVGRSATLLIGWVTAFVPGRIGVAEGGAAALFELLGIGAGVGLTFALLRRVRRMVVIPIGFVISAGSALRGRATA